MQTATDALVLRERKLDEQDRLLTLLSAEQGIITAYAKGAGRMKGSMAGATELLCYSHFVLFQNRALHYFLGWVYCLYGGAGRYSFNHTLERTSRSAWSFAETLTNTKKSPARIKK